VIGRGTGILPVPQTAGQEKEEVTGGTPVPRGTGWANRGTGILPVPPVEEK